MKLLLIGDERVGKSTLVRRLDDANLWSPGFPYHETVGADCRYLRDGKTQFEVWDLAGNQRYRALLKVSTKQASRLVLVADVSRPETYFTLIKMLSLMFGSSGASEETSAVATVVLLHNKVDLPHGVSIEQGSCAARDAVGTYFPTAKLIEARCGAETPRDELRRTILFRDGVLSDMPRFMHGSVRLPSSLPPNETVT